MARSAHIGDNAPHTAAARRNQNTAPINVTRLAKFVLGRAHPARPRTAHRGASRHGAADRAARVPSGPRARTRDCRRLSHPLARPPRLCRGFRRVGRHGAANLGRAARSTSLNSLLPGAPPQRVRSPRLTGLPNAVGTLVLTALPRMSATDRSWPRATRRAPRTWGPARARDGIGTALHRFLLCRVLCA